MATNKELVQQAVAAIPLWRAFLDQKEAEQDAILAEMRNENEGESKPKKLIKKLTARFRSQPAASAQQASRRGYAKGVQSKTKPVSSSGKETPNRMSELPKVEVKASEEPKKPVVKVPVNDKAENNQKNNAENDLLDKEVEVNLPTPSPTSTNSAEKNEVAPRVMPVTTKEPIQQVSEDNNDDDNDNDGDDDNDNEFKDIF